MTEKEFYYSYCDLLAKTIEGHIHRTGKEPTNLLIYVGDKYRIENYIESDVIVGLTNFTMFMGLEVDTSYSLEPGTFILSHYPIK